MPKLPLYIAHIPCQHENRGWCYDREEVFIFPTFKQAIIVGHCRLFVNTGLLSSILEHIGVSYGNWEQLRYQLEKKKYYSLDNFHQAQEDLLIKVENKHWTKELYWFDPIKNGKWVPRKVK
jgi:hypothetical protein